MKEIRKLNVIFGKNGKGATSTRITLPLKYVESLGITKENRGAIISLENKKIIIERGELEMRKLTVKEINELTIEKLEAIMTNEQKTRMFELYKNNDESNKYSAFLDNLQESANLSGQEENEEHISIAEYLDYLEEN